MPLHNIMASLVPTTKTKTKTNASTITKDDCLEWIKNPLVNPRTRRKITATAGIYKTYANKCKMFGITPSGVDEAPKSPKGRICKNKWRQLGNYAGEFGFHSHFICKCEKAMMRLYAVHNLIAIDGECPWCGHNIDLRYYCLVCKNNEDADEGMIE